MSLFTLLGQRRSMFEETEQHARLLQLTSPVLTDLELESIRRLKDKEFSSVTLETVFPVNDGIEGLEKAIRRLCREAGEAIDQGKKIVILSDRSAGKELIHIPALLAVGAAHHYLIREGKRMKASIVCETAEARDVHHVALLIGYGASAVNPYLAYEVIRSLVEQGEFKDLDLPKGLRNYKKALDEGILKIMSKMGISTVSSYHGAQIFETIGLDNSLVNDCFTGTSSRVGGISYPEIAADLLKWHKSAFSEERNEPSLEAGGYYRFRRDGEYHAFNPDVIRFLHAAVESGQWEDYQKFADAVNHREPVTLRDLLDFAKRQPIPIEEVEPVEEIRKKFCVSGMSHGALSRETHETLAMAMNRIKGKSSSGEGGEDSSRFYVLKNGDSPNSVIKQVASGRFGVTPEYLASAIQFEIKMAQGSKPGEGGQLPGHKVTQEIANNRHTVPGVALISPPPHHDIYSIEDLAQLIYDLKASNARATVCVKLVSEAGVGTIAAGVAKGHADTILISGHDGGTGASPLSSIKYAGSAWELGLSEAQQVLVLNDLRGRVRLRADGGQKTGRDVVFAAILGAEEYGFGTAPVVAAGCCMVRQCHLNTCPVGVATQDEKLRAKYDGPVEHVVNYFNFVAQEIREILARLGFKKLEE
ncbi:MAG: glutamate synthase subunit alpha, partial [Candidatus Omnitrophica bacterium]|nr:glutamate synthase subunit alpha [Candidatus Omnitrophota bacterium]